MESAIEDSEQSDDCMTKLDDSISENIAQTEMTSEDVLMETMVPMAPFGSQTEPLPILQNIVSTVNLCVPINLRQMALSCKNTEFNPRRLNAIIVRIREPRTTALIFASGKMVCTGAKNEEDSRLASRKFARIVQKLGYDAKFINFKIHNIVASCDLGFNISLEALSIGHRDHCSYEAEIFPGLIYHMLKPKIVLLIFVSGKIVLTGAKQRSQIFEAFKIILPTLKKFSKEGQPIKSIEV